MSPRWIRLLGAAFACLLLLGCGDDGPEPGSDEISDLAVSESELIHIIDVSGDTTKGTQSVTFENHSSKLIWASAYHNGCGGGLCVTQSVPTDLPFTFIPSEQTRDYDEITQIFTYIAEGFELAVSVLLTMASGGAGSALLAEEAAQVGAEAASEAAVVSVEAGSEGAEAAGAGVEAEQTGLQAGAESSGGTGKLSWSRKLGINVSTQTTLGMIEGGLKGGWKHGASGAFNGALQAFERSVVSAVASEAGKEVFAGMKGALGAFGSTTLSKSTGEMPDIAEDAVSVSGKVPGRLSTFTSHLGTTLSAKTDEDSTIFKEMAKGLEADHPFSATVRKFVVKNASKAAKASFKLVMPKAKTYSLMVITGEHQTEEESEYLEVTREMLDAISDDMNADPANKELLAELRAAFVNENVPMDRGIRALAVAHNLYVNAPSLRGELVTLFQDEAEIRDLYTGYLPASMHAGADTLNTYYHLALSAEDHTLYLRLNTAFAEAEPVAPILSLLEARDLAEEGFAIDAATLEANGYRPLHLHTAVDRQNGQNLMQCARMALGMPVPIKLWAQDEWAYTVDYNGRLYRNMAGFFRDGAGGAPDFDYWYVPWYAPGHPKHNTFWQEVVGNTNHAGAFQSGKTSWDTTGWRPESQHLYIDDNTSLEMYLTDIEDADWSPHWDEVLELIGHSSRENTILVTFSTDESISWWKGLKVTAPDIDPTTGDPNDEVHTELLEVKEDGVEATMLIPLGNIPERVKEWDEYSDSDFFERYLQVLFEFQGTGAFNVHFTQGQTTYRLMDLVGKHVRVHWVHDGGNDSDFYDVPGEYDVNGDGINVVEATQVERSDGAAEIDFKIGEGISWWKGIAVQKSDGNKMWLGSQDFVQNAPGRIFSADPEGEWGKYVHVELWKAAFLGIHTYQKRIKVPTSQLVGKTTTFDWKYDDMNYHPLTLSGYTADGGHDSIAVEVVGPAPQVIDMDLSQLPPFDEALLEELEGAKINFQVPPGMTWWKSIQIRGVDGSKTLQWTQDDTKTADSVELVEMVLPKGDNVDGCASGQPCVALEFWKAKVFGIHTYVGEAKITWESIVGKEVTFTWEND